VKEKFMQNAAENIVNYFFYAACVAFMLFINGCVFPLSFFKHIIMQPAESSGRNDMLNINAIIKLTSALTAVKKSTGKAIYNVMFIIGRFVGFSS
jgi:hypothetical protein